MGIRAAQPGLPALVNIRHSEASTTAIIAKLMMSMMMTITHTSGSAALLVAGVYEGVE
jgi:hypothetical protein